MVNPQNAAIQKATEITGFSKKELAVLWRVPFSNEIDPIKIEMALRERIKELNCLYGISQLAERHLQSLDDLLQKMVTFLPWSWQYPEIACARILFKGKTYVSEKFTIHHSLSTSRMADNQVLHNRRIYEIRNERDCHGIDGAVVFIQ